MSLSTHTVRLVLENTHRLFYSEKGGGGELICTDGYGLASAPFEQ